MYINCNINIYIYIYIHNIYIYIQYIYIYIQIYIYIYLQHINVYKYIIYCMYIHFLVSRYSRGSYLYPQTTFAKTRLHSQHLRSFFTGAGAVQQQRTRARSAIIICKIKRGNWRSTRFMGASIRKSLSLISVCFSIAMFDYQRVT